jgi:hypothetical protein
VIAVALVTNTVDTHGHALASRDAAFRTLPRDGRIARHCAVGVDVLAVARLIHTVDARTLATAPIAEATT